MRRPTPRSPRRSTSTARDRSEVARHERQDARRDHRRSPARNAIGSFSIIEALKLLVDAPFVLWRRVPRFRRAAPAVARRRATARARTDAAAPRPMPPIGSTQAIRSKPWVCGVESTPGPNCATIASMIWEFASGTPRSGARSPPSSRRERRVRSSRVAWHVDADERVSRSPARLRACARRRGPRARAPPVRPGRASRAASARRMPSSICARDAGPTMCGGITRPRRSMKNVSGSAGDAPLRPRAPERVPDVRVVDPVPLQVRVRRPLESCALTRGRRRHLRRSTRAGPRRCRAPRACTGTQVDCQKLTTTTLPRSEARLSRPEPVSRGRSSFGAGTILPLSTLAATPGPFWCARSQTSRPSSARTEATATARKRAHHRTKTVVPMSTCSKSHSESGTCMRTQPCEAL